MTRTSSPGARPRRPSAAHGSTSIQASGAPSKPCFGARDLALSFDRIRPMGRSRAPFIGLLERLPVEDQAGRRGVGVELAVRADESALRDGRLLAAVDQLPLGA